MTNPKIVIIGAGPCGLGAALHLNRLGFKNWVLYEKASYVGGLSASFTDDNNFTWDIGGHVLFSHYKQFSQILNDFMPESEWYHHTRESWIRCFDSFVPYPFQLNLHRLPTEVMIRCLEGLIDIAEADRNHLKPTNFRDWILASCGPELAKVFMLPYNSKVWGWPLEEMDTKWMGERVATVDLKRLIRNVVLKQDDVSWGPNNTFMFPKHGGTGNIWNQLYNTLPTERIKLETSILSIDTSTHEITLSDGEVVGYDYLLSTMPISKLAQLIRDTKMEKATAELKYSSTHVIGIGMNGNAPEEISDKCWMYFPEENCPFYRVTHFSHYSRNNVQHPGKQWSLMAEVSETDYKQQSHDPQLNITQTLDGMIHSGLIANTENVCSSWYKRIEHGYPTPTRNRNDIIFAALHTLKSQQIFSRGRFGAWRYEVGNMDHSFMQGYEWVDCIFNKSPEMTLNHPEIVNTQKA